MLLIAMLCVAGGAWAQQALPYEYGFENNDLATEGWIANFSSSSSGIKNTVSAVHSGSYGFVFYYKEQNGSLISPLLTSGDKGVEVSFWYKEYSSQYGDEQFLVGYTTDETVTDPDAFEYGDEITASTAWQQYQNTFPAGTKRIAIKYIYNDAFYLYLDDFVFDSNDGYVKPTDLTVSEITKNSVKLSWTEKGTATAWVVAYKADGAADFTEVNATENPFILTGLTPATEYTVKVRQAGDTNKWSDESTFTTDVTFPTPKELTASNITSNTADISWIGNTEANSYNLRYAINSDFFDDFENGIDAKGWTVVRNGGGNANTDWCVVNSNTIFSNEAIPAHSGDYVAMSRSYAGEAYNVDNWMISPQVELGGTLIYWVMDDGQYHEHYDIYVCTTSFDADAFDESVFTKIYEPGDASREWTEHTVDLSAYAGQTGYIAFRNTDYDQDFLFIDDVTITVPSASVEWTTVNDVTNPYTIEGLTRETKYKVEVQAVYEGGSSAWTSTTFTTLAADAVPSNLQTANITATTATLNWEGVQDSYNVRYRKNPVFYFNSFNSDEERAGWDFNNAIYGIDDPVYNISGSSNFFLSMGWNSTDEEFIVSPELPAYPSGSTLEFYPFYYSAANTFQIGYSTTIRDDVDAYTWSDPIAPVSLGEAYSTKFSEVLPDGVKYIAFRATASDQTHCIFIDDFKIFDSAAIDEWDKTISNVNATTLAISDLTNGTEYEWQVQGNWTEGTTEWSKSASFTTIAILNLNDAEDNSTLLAAANGKIAEVTLVGRTLTSGMWNTFAVPFNISEDDLDNLGITAKRLASSTLTDGTLTLNFEDATSIEAGKPYLVKVADNLDLGAITFDGVTVSKDIVPFTSSNVDFIPTFGKTTIGEEGDDAKNVLFLAAENTLKNPTSLPADIKGFRAYFQLKGDAVGARAFSLDLGDVETTGVTDVRSKMADVRGDYFDLQGCKVENTAKKGIYIQNGRKVVIK